ncbi:MAG TPA: hypothetical protein VFA23_16260 [Dongiaceae bacterium]|nr:hypothetical protein [Dongiaceae bacterium]
MSRYQCYFLTSDRHIARERRIEAGDDLEALRKSRRALARESAYRAFELWQRDRRVGSELDGPPATEEGVGARRLRAVPPR